MISIFNGHMRRLGETTESRNWIQVEVGLREHLALFKGARLAVFMAISLHINADGIAFPAIPRLVEETGYNRTTVFDTLAELTTLEIAGHRVLQSRDRRYASGQFAGKEYRVFPTAADLKEWQDAPVVVIDKGGSYVGVDSKAATKKRKKTPQQDLPDTENVDTVSDAPCTGFPYPVKPDTAEPDMVAPYTILGDSEPCTGFPDTVNATLSRTTHQVEPFLIDKEETAASRSVREGANAVPVEPAPAAAVIFDKSKGENPEIAELAKRLIALGVDEGEVIRLATQRPEVCEAQISYLPFRDVTDNQGGLLRRAIEGNWSAPPRWKAEQEAKQKAQQGQTVRDARQRAAQAEVTTAEGLLAKYQHELSQEEFKRMEDDAFSMLPETLQKNQKHPRFDPQLTQRLLVLSMMRAGIDCPWLRSQTNYDWWSTNRAKTSTSHGQPREGAGVSDSSSARNPNPLTSRFSEDFKQRVGADNAGK